MIQRTHVGAGGFCKKRPSVSLIQSSGNASRPGSFTACPRVRPNYDFWGRARVFVSVPDIQQHGERQMNTRNSFLVAVAGIALTCLPAVAFANVVSLEDFCGEYPYLDWDPTTSTCTQDGHLLLASISETLVIRAGETLQILSSSDINILGMVFNSGTIRVDDSDLHLTSLINTGELWIGENQGVVALGDGLDVPNVNVGTIRDGYRLVAVTDLNNLGEIDNAGLLENWAIFDNRGRVANGEGQIENHETGIINNYRCPGTTGVVTSGAGNITNDGIIQFINGGDCR